MEMLRNSREITVNLHQICQRRVLRKAHEIPLRFCEIE